MAEILPGVLTREIPIDQLKVRDCDFALWEPTTRYGEGIARATGGPFSHVTGLVLWNGEPWSVGFEEKRGGHACPLRAEVDRHPGKIHVFRVAFQGPTANVRERLLDVRGEYDWANIRTLGAVYALKWLLPFRVWQAIIANREGRTGGGICSRHLARSWGEGAGVRFLSKPYEQITPNDLGFSPASQYVGTPIPT
jgi:hypothetical protein